MSNSRRPKSDESFELRKAGGQWLKRVREERNLSQSQLAALLGSDHYTFISQIEIGRSRVPPERYRDWAKALDIDEHEFICQMLRYYDPALFSMVLPYMVGEASHSAV